MKNKTRILLDKAGDSVFSVLFGRRCFACKKLIPVFSSEKFCRDCKESIKPFDDCTFYGNGGEMLIATAPYFEAWRKSLISFKFYGRREIGYYHAEKLAENIRNNIDISDFDGVLCVPCKTLNKNRRYNQAEVLARRVSLILGLPFCGYMKKKKDIKSQTACKNASERFKNVEGVYGLTKEGVKEVKGKSFILVDDICTTGATLSSCGRALKEGGVKTVVFATSAKTVYGKVAGILKIPAVSSTGEKIVLKKRWKKPTDFEKAARKRLDKTLFPTVFTRRKNV